MIRSTTHTHTHTIMTNQDFTAKAEMMLEKMSTEQLKDMLEQLFHDHRPGADKVFDAVLNHLEKRVSWSEFAMICNAIG
jgi:hypothetical protein